MADSPLFAPLTAPIVRPLRWIGLALAALIAAIGAGLRLRAVDAGAIRHLHDGGDLRAGAVALERLLRPLGGGSRRCAVARPRSADGRQLSARAALRGFIFDNKGVLAGLAHSDRRLRHSGGDADGLSYLAEFLHRPVSCRVAGLHDLASRAFGDNRSAFIGLMVLGHDVRRRVACTSQASSRAPISSRCWCSRPSLGLRRSGRRWSRCSAASTCRSRFSSARRTSACSI